MSSTHHNIILPSHTPAVEIQAAYLTVQIREGHQEEGSSAVEEH